MADNPCALHHIGAVAHHFLAGSTVDTAHEDVHASDPARPSSFHYAVASASATHLSAFAASQLALASVRTVVQASSGCGGSLPRRVILREWSGCVWSAFPWLNPGAAHDPVAVFRRGTTSDEAEMASELQLASSYTATGCPGPDDGWVVDGRTGASHRVGQEQGPVLGWFNLGAATSDHLALLEATSGWCHGAVCPLGGRDGLVWCVFGEEVSSWRTAYALGRLVAVTQPACCVILVFSPAWLHDNLARGYRRTGEETMAQNATDGVCNRYGEDDRRMNRVAMYGCPLTFLTIPAPDSGAEVVRKGVTGSVPTLGAFWRDVLDRLQGS